MRALLVRVPGGTVSAAARIKSAVFGGIGDLFRGFGSGAQAAERRLLEHQAVAAYRGAVRLQKKDLDPPDPMRAAALSRVVGAAIELANDLSGGCSGELAFAADVYEELCPKIPLVGQWLR